MFYSILKVGISLDETVTEKDLNDLLEIFNSKENLVSDLIKYFDCLTSI